jgi:hypothetical protein
MTDRGKVTIVVCAFVAVVGLGLAQGDFYDEGSSAWDIAGWVLFMLALLVGVAAALLGDRSKSLP